MENNDQFKAAKFLKELYRNCKEDGFINIRILPDGENIFIPLADLGSNAAVRAIKEIKKKYKDKDIYFAVATRQDGEGKKKGIIEITALWADVDLNGRSWKEVWKMLMDFPIKPSVIIRTGGGYHAYWFLEIPATKEQIPEIESLMNRMASYMGSDKNVCDASRILRVPGTTNHEEGYRVRIKTLHPNRRYKIEDFDFLPPVKEDQKVDDFPSWSDKLLLDGVSEGERNDAITKLAGRYVGMGLSKVEIMPILLDANSKFTPPLNEPEVTKTLNSVLRTHQTNNPDDTGKIYTPQRGEGRDLLQILAEPLEEPDHLIKPILQAEDKGFLVSSFKIGKTLLSEQMTLCLSKGIPFLGFPVPKPRKVLFIRFELSWRRFKKSLHMMETGLNPPGQYQVVPIFELERGFNILNKKDFDWLIWMIDKHEPALLILDPFYKLTNWDLKDTASAMPLIRQFESIRERYNNLCILITAHRVKAGENERGWDTTYGPMIFLADADFQLRLRVNKRDSKNPIFTLDHISNDETIETMYLRRDPNTLLYYPDHTIKEKKQDREKEELEKARGLLVSFIQQNSRKPNQTEFRGLIESELKVKDPKPRKIIKGGLDKYWKELPERKGRSILYEPILNDNSNPNTGS